MTYSDDHIALAAEYALGTLDADERALVETMMIVDHGFMEMVDAWDRKLAPLHQMVAPVEPPNDLWPRIKAAAGLTGQQAPIILPEASREHVASQTQTDHPVRDVAPELVIVPQDHLAREPIAPIAHEPHPHVRRSGYGFGMVMSALAAALAGVIALQAYRPELLPETLRIKPQIRVVEVPAPATVPAQLVAVLQEDASQPAFILTVDTATRTFTVRKVGAPSQPNKSFELWIVSDKLQRPRSLGVIGESEFTTRPALASYDPEVVNSATYAVTLEQKGGSPNGAPTSNPLWAGKLVESVPAQPAH